MRRIGILMACGALAFSAGCDNRGGGDDAGMVVTGCSVAGATGFPALPEACVPRCSAATGGCIDGCQSMTDPAMRAACVNTCLMNDTTPAETIDFGGGMSQQLNCNGCWNWGINHCVFESCGEQFAGCINCAADQCDPDTAGCEAEETALDTCVETNLTTIQTCFQMQAPRCF